MNCITTKLQLSFFKCIFKYLIQLLTHIHIQLIPLNLVGVLISYIHFLSFFPPMFSSHLVVIFFPIYILNMRVLQSLVRAHLLFIQFFVTYSVSLANSKILIHSVPCLHSASKLLSITWFDKERSCLSSLAFVLFIFLW